MDKKRVVGVLFLIILVLIVACKKDDTPKVKVTSELEDEFILDGEHTNLILEARNVGDVVLNGKFVITPEDSDIVNVSYAGDETFKILPGESIKKSYDLTGNTKTYETGVKLKIELIDLNNNTVLWSDEDLVLYIKQE
jgi:hypothetical protein